MHNNNYSTLYSVFHSNGNTKYLSRMDTDLNGVFDF